jgi:uncharacterized membrane protein
MKSMDSRNISESNFAVWSIGMNDGSQIPFQERKQILRAVKRKRKEWQRDKKRLARQMRKLEREIGTLYPNPALSTAIELFRDEDIVWRGDVDLIRIPVADLLEKINACGLFVEEANEIAAMILLEAPE